MADWAWKLAVAAALVLAGNLVGSWLSTVAHAALDRTGLDPMVRRALTRAVRPVVVTVAVIAALEHLDVDLTTVAAMAGAVTLAIGLALQTSLSNVASGALLLTLRPYRDGEQVECGGEEGVVLEQGAFAVTLERADGVRITVPNNAAFRSAIRNHDRAGRLRVELSVLLDPDAGLAGARAAIEPVLAAEARLLGEPAPAVRFGIEDRGVRMRVTAWVRPADRAGTTSDLCEATLAALRTAGVPLAPTTTGRA